MNVIFPQVTGFVPMSGIPWGFISFGELQLGGHTIGLEFPPCAGHLVYAAV